MTNTQSNNEFPRELLNQSPEDRLDYFKQPETTFMHNLLKSNYEKLYRKIIKPKPSKSTIIFLMGPSGVGKTTLEQLVTKKLLSNSLTQMKSQPEWAPIVSVEATAPGRGLFRWKQFYEQVLVEVDEPGIDYKIDFEKITYDVQWGISREGSDNNQLKIQTRATEDSLFKAMLKALIYRHPYTFSVDEFHHIGIRADEEEIQYHMDCIKSIVNQSNVPCTGFGTYELLDFLDLTPELTRRTHIIHFHRYRWEVENEKQEFERILKSLLRRMPLAKTPRLTKGMLSFCYERSIGAMGRLIDWLYDAYDLSLQEDSDTLTMEHLEETAPSEEEAIKAIEDAIKGEKRLFSKGKKSKRLQNLLKMDDSSNSDDSKNNSSSQKKSETDDSDKKNEKEQKGKKGKPFQRKPKRDSLDPPEKEADNGEA